MPEIDYGPVANFIRPQTGADQKNADDVKRAILGDHEAAKRLADAGKLVPCAHCGNDNDYRIVMSFKKDKKKRFGEYYDVCTIYCECCTETVRQAGLGKDVAAKNASLLWNTRAPILSAEELKKLEENT